jgi:hypothetical protein
MQLGYTKYCRFLCEWDSRDKRNHCANKLWHKRTALPPGQKKVVNPPLVLRDKIYLSHLHIKLDLMKNFVKGMDKAGHNLEYVKNKLPNVSDAKTRRVHL